MPPNFATGVRLQRSGRGQTSQPFRRAIWMVTAVVSTEVAKATTNGKTSSHMGKNRALLSLFLLDVLNYRADDLVQ